MSITNLAASFRIQATACTDLGSPFYGALLKLAAQDLEAGGPIRDLMQPWTDASVREVIADAAHLRLLGALHDLVLSGDDLTLAANFPHVGTSPDMLATWQATRAAMAAHHDRIAAFMNHEPQTNEVRRSACLAPGFLEIARRMNLPIRAFEVGASAGLNLNWDRYAYRFGETTWGDPNSPVQIDTEWTGPAPPVDAKVEVIHRAACDRRPGDLSDPVARRRLLAYIWPDQFERLARIRAAIDLALELGVCVETADAAQWPAQVAMPQAGAVTVLYHSVFWQYMPPESQAKLAKIIEDLGAMATPDAPFAWLRMEPMAGTVGPVMDVTLTMWPGGSEQILGETHPHGAWVKWN